METGNLHFVVERNIPFIAGLLEPYGQVDYLRAEDFTPGAVKEADALIVRTRTRCDAALLSGSKCGIVATATIGTDHIDLGWCAARGIEVANAPGCNAPGVAQYVFASLLRLVPGDLDKRTIGIVGVGHVGKIVEQWARSLGMRVLLCDPPRQAAEGGSQWSTLAEIAAQADIITFHTPLDDTTRHIADATFFGALQRSPIIVNAARGPIVDTGALVAALDSGQVSAAVIDCWEGEPAIDAALLERCAIATPHIAGYSYEGKVRGTRMALDAVAAHLGLPKIGMAQQAAPQAPSAVEAQAIIDSYDPLVDTQALKANPSKFEQLRNNYDFRHEVQG